MHPLEKECRGLLEEKALVRAGETVLVAVSGGADSVALLHLLSRLRGKLGITPMAAHLDHGLRPAEAEAEADLVRDLAQGLEVECFLGRVDVARYASRHRLSLEHAARLLRYAYLEDTAAGCGAAKIALAHTADDQAEEILLRLIRGSGRKGLSGMQFMRDNRYIRPFLLTPKHRLLDYLRRYRIPHCEDSSNQQRDFLRNRIRLDLLPLLTERYNPNIRERLLETASILQEEEALLARLTGSARERILSRPGKAEEQPRACPPPLRLDLAEFAAQHPAIQRRIMESACWIMGYRPQYRTIEQLRRLALTSETGARLHFGEGLRVVKEKTQLLFSYPAGKAPRRGD